MRWHTGVLVALSVGFAFNACTDEVFRDRPLYEDPATEAMGFLGYFDEAENLTSCGNCHIGIQRQWEDTDHADAWAGLQASPAAQMF
ncbi:MAG: hypothetical protein ACR2QM_15210 [Longimicrobiales bacterium]